MYTIRSWFDKLTTNGFEPFFKKICRENERALNVHCNADSV